MNLIKPDGSLLIDTEAAGVLPGAKLLLNPMQLILELAPQRIRVTQVGRGGGKSTGAAIDIKNVVYDMPRSKNFILGETYQQILTRTLPSTIKALEMLGFYKDLHYFVGRLPPKNWKWNSPYEPPLDAMHTITFFNGSCYDLLSQDTNSRGGNYSSGMVDEAQDIDQGKLESQVIPTMRGEYERFKNRRTYRRLSMYCSMPRMRRAEWIFQYQELAKQFPLDYLWIEGPSAINAHNLPPDWFKDQQRILLPSEYDIEIRNIRPKKVIGGFYPLFNDRVHTYIDFNNDHLDGIIDNNNGYNAQAFEQLNSLQDNDVQMDQPLEISFDWGAWFNGVVTCQEYNNVFRYLSAMSIDESERIEDLVTKWCTYYRFHRNRNVHFWYDHTAIGKNGIGATYAEIVTKTLISHGFNPIHFYIGQQPGHDDRYKFWGYAHKGDHPNIPKFIYNRHHCKYLIISINNANIKQGRNGFEKDKADEKNRNIDQRTTTHFSDAHDTIALGKYGARTEERTSVVRTRTR